MICPACNTSNQPGSEECFVCGKAVFALTQGSVLAQRYEILRLVGHGGMGRVYEAQDRVLEERVAIKVLRPQFAREPDMARRFLSEVRLARRITHTNVCRLHEYGESDGIRYLCMELVDGVNLKDVLKTRRLPEGEAYAVSEAAAEGLAAVHAQDVIHRDFKTANIMVDTRGQVKVMDFGIAKELGSESTGISMAGHVLGTPEYMSPEHAQGGRLDFRSDIYALGCVVFEVFTGRTIFSGGNPIETLRRHLYDPVPLGEEAAPQLPEALRPVLERALAKRPEDRQGSVREFIDDLMAARDASPLLAMLDDAPVPLPAPAPSRPPIVRPPTRPTLPLPDPSRPVPAGDTRLLTPGPRPPARPRRWPWWAAAVAIVTVAVGAFALRGRGEPEVPMAVAPMASPSTVSPTPTPSPLAIASAQPEPESTPASVAAAPTPAATSPSVRVPAAPTRQPVRASSPAPPPVAATTPPPSSLAAALGTPTPQPTVEPAAAETGVLMLLIVPPSEVTVGADRLGVLTAARELRLAPGEYTVRIVHPEYLPLQRKMTVRSGTITELVMDLSDKGVKR
jgi:eukaryotic-like serine/threonine-protein kinase